MTFTLHELPGAECPHRRGFWRDLELPVEFVDSIAEPLKAKIGGLIVEPSQSDEWLKKIKSASTDVIRVGFLDSLLQDHGRLWPRNLYFSVFREAIVRAVGQLDITSWAYVAAEGPWARFGVAVAFDLGYRRVRVICNQEGAVDDLRERMSHFCFGLEVEGLRTSDVTLQPNNGSMLLNAYDLSKDPDMSQTLLYLNFVRLPGVIVDVSKMSVMSPLIQEGQNAHYDCIDGALLRGGYDFQLLSTLGVPLVCEVHEYIEKWKSYLAKSGENLTTTEGKSEPG